MTSPRKEKQEDPNMRVINDEEIKEAFAEGKAEDLIRNVLVSENGERIGMDRDEVDYVSKRIRQFAGENPSKEVCAAVSDALETLLKGDAYDVYCAVLLLGDLFYEESRGRNAFGIDFGKTLESVENAIKRTFSEEFSETSVSWPSKTEYMKYDAEAIVRYMKANVGKI